MIIDFRNPKTPLRVELQPSGNPKRKRGNYRGVRCNNMPGFRFGLGWHAICALALGLTMHVAAGMSAEQAPPSRNAVDSSLDALLLETLDAELLKGLDVDGNRGTPAQPAAPRPDLPSGDLPGADGRLLDQAGVGEDLGQETENPLLSIGRQMRVAEDLISQQVTARDRTQRVQRLIVEDLDRLIEQLQQQCSRAQCQGGTSSPKPEETAGGKSQAGSGENRGANQPVRDSTDRLGTAQADDAELARLQQMLKRVWGHLPTKVREQMQSGAIEEFLPKYEKLIEAYYSRLAEIEE
jgi:hypothetical protein